MLNAVGMIVAPGPYIFLKNEDPTRLDLVREFRPYGLQINYRPDKRSVGMLDVFAQLINGLDEGLSIDERFDSRIQFFKII
jgi:hypothetical protein